MEGVTKAVKFIKLFSTGVATYKTLFLTPGDDGKLLLQDDGQTHEFTDAVDAVSRCTEEVFIFWDNMPIGVGAVKES